MDFIGRLMAIKIISSEGGIFFFKIHVPLTFCEEFTASQKIPDTPGIMALGHKVNRQGRRQGFAS